MIKTGIDHTKILFLDIETVPFAHGFYDLPAPLAIAWKSIFDQRYADEKDERGNLLECSASFQKYAALYPEFGKIICISMGFFKTENEFAVKAYYGTDEKKLLEEVNDAISKASFKYKIIGGHNLKQFDVPYFIRRAVINNVNLITTFDLYQKKPWDLDGIFVDTMEIWKSLAMNLGSSSLESISAALGFPSPKEEMNGSMVSTYYYLPSGPDFKKIGNYCNGDVYSCARLYLRITKGHSNFKVIENII